MFYNNMSRRKQKKTLELDAVLLHSDIYGIFSRTLITQWQQKYAQSTLYSNNLITPSALVQVVAIVSCLFVVVSTLCLIFSTLPAFQQKDGSGKITRKSSYKNDSNAIKWQRRILQ